MRHELKRVDPIRAANITAVVYGVLMCVFALIAAPFFLLAGILGSGEAAGAFGLSAFMLILYPVIGVVMGWVSGALTSVVYNYIVRWTGGILFELDAASAAPGGAPV